MLPFLKTKPQTGVIVDTRKADGHKEPESHDNEGLQACADDLIKAVNAKDAKATAAALKAAFEICDSQPHEEGPEPHSYEAQNQKAAK